MNVQLEPEELLRVYETLVRSTDVADNAAILEKLKKPILSALEKEHEKVENLMFKNWTESESRKIQILKDDLSNINKAKSRKSRG
jgi:hypothetical protein